MKLNEINYERKPNFILCSYVTDSGSYIKEKYIGYNLCEAKRLFKSKYNNL